MKILFKYYADVENYESFKDFNFNNNQSLTRAMHGKAIVYKFNEIEMYETQI